MGRGLQGVGKGTMMGGGRRRGLRGQSRGGGSGDAVRGGGSRRRAMASAASGNRRRPWDGPRALGKSSPKKTKTFSPIRSKSGVLAFRC